MTRLVVVIALACSATPAAADWQFTRWGMTPGEVQKASPTPLQLYTDADQNTETETTLLTGSYSASTLQFTTAFRFNYRTHRLTTVALELVDTARCGELWRSMNSVYGKPLRELHEGYATTGLWRDEKARNQVSYLLIGSVAEPASCSVSYREIKDKAASGL